MVTIYKPKINNKVLNRVSKQDEFERIMSDPVYFINQYCYTFDPRPGAEPHDLPFRLYPYQEEYVRWIVEQIEQGQDCFTEKSRDMGVTWMIMAVILWFWLFKPGFRALLGSRKESYVDDNTTSSHFGMIMYMLDRLPFKPKGFNDSVDRTRLKLINPDNGNTIAGESANVNFSRQGRYTVIFMDEIAFWENPEMSWTAAGQSTRCRLAVTTPPKRFNFISALRRLISGGHITIPMKTVHWRQHPLKTEEWYEAQKAGKMPEEVAQEIDINWEGSITGRVYPEVEHIRVGEFNYRPDWPLYLSHDFGRRPDPHAMGWYQVDPETGRVRLLDTFEKVDRIIDWFAPLFGHPIDSQYSYTTDELALIKKVNGWRKGIHFGDPAGKQHGPVAAKSVIERLEDFGVYVQCNTKANDLESRKLETRRLLMQFDLNDTPSNRYWLECMKNARYPERSDNAQPLGVQDKPIHDWTSHMRTMTEYFAVNYKYQGSDPEFEGYTFNKALATMKRDKEQRSYLGYEGL